MTQTKETVWSDRTSQRKAGSAVKAQGHGTHIPERTDGGEDNTRTPGTTVTTQKRQNGRKSGWHDNIEVTQINLHRSKAASATLAKRMEDRQTFVVLVQEPWTCANKVCGRIPNTNMYVGAQPARRPRACLYTSKNIKAWMMAEFSDEDMVTIQITDTTNKNNKLIIASVYMAAENPAPPQKMEMLAVRCEKRNKLIVGGDCNSHHTVWGSTDTNQRGEDLLDFLCRTGLTWSNIGRRPTFQTRTREEVLDLTMVNDTAQRSVLEWKVDEEMSMSDHNYISFKIGETRTQKIKIRNIRNTDWARYKQVLSEKLQNKPTCSDTSTIDEIETVVGATELAIREAYHASCPERYIQTKPHMTWWNRKLTELREGIHHAHIAAKRRKTNATWRAMLELQKEYKREIRRAKRTAWRSFTESIEKQQPLARTWKALKTDRSTQISSVLHNGCLTATPEETLEHLLRHHVPEEVGNDTADNWTRGKGLSPEESKQITRPAQLEAGVKAFDPFKSPGADGIYPKMLQEGWKVLGPIYQTTYTACLTQAYVPRTWNKSRAVFIPKPGKNTYQEVKSYRMISLTSFQLKLLERAILRWMNAKPGLQDKLNKRQFGFRPGVSTDTALHTLTSKIEKALDDKEFALCVFLDIENAFPTLTFAAMERALRRLELEEGIVNWISAMLREREITATLADISKTKKVTKGCPQGGILSPFLWNAAMDQLLHELQGKHLYTQAYADDIAGVVVGIDPATLYTQAQTIINKAVRWGHGCGLKFSKAKTEAVMFTRRRAWHTTQTLKIEGSTITPSPRAKYLGIMIDAKLTYKDHVEMQVKKATAALVQTRRLVGKTWGLTPKMTKWIYKTMIMPILTYGSLTWIGGIQTKKSQMRLGRLQRLACMLITSAYPSTPTAALEMLTGLLPLDLVLTREAIMTSVRLEVSSGWSNNATTPTSRKTKNHRSICERHRRDIPALQLPTDHGVLETLEDPKFSVRLDDRPEAVEFEKGIPPTELKCFTDGSKLENGSAGAGAVVYKNTREQEEIWLHLGVTSTVYQAEVTAITVTAQTLLNKETQGEKITFLSDSKAAILSLKKTRMVGKTVKECAKKLNALAEQNTVRICWIPGHMGVPGNEKADELAKKGAETRTMGPEPFLPLARANVRAEIEKWAQEQHKQTWNSRIDCRQTQEAVGWVTQGLVEKLASLSRADLRIALQAITGHCNLNRHRKLQGKVKDGLCPKCYEEDETPEHVVGQCLFWEGERVRWFGVSQTTIGQILAAKNVRSLVGFLRETGRLENFASD